MYNEMNREARKALMESTRITLRNNTLSDDARANAHHILAQCLVAEYYETKDIEDIDKALKNHNAAIVLKPQESSYLVARGKVYTLKGQHYLAALDVTEALTLSEKDPNILKAFCTQEAAADLLRLQEVKDSLQSLQTDYRIPPELATAITKLTNVVGGLILKVDTQGREIIELRKQITELRNIILEHKQTSAQDTQSKIENVQKEVDTLKAHLSKNEEHDSLVEARVTATAQNVEALRLHQQETDEWIKRFGMRTVEELDNIKKQIDVLVVDQRDTYNILLDLNSRLRSLPDMGCLPEALQKIVGREKDAQDAKMQLQEIMRDAPSYKSAFYTELRLELNSVFIASMAIKSGLVGIEAQGVAAKAGQVCKALEAIPVIGSGVKFFGTMLTAIAEVQTEVNCMHYLELTSSIVEMDQFSDKLSRQLTNAMIDQTLLQDDQSFFGKISQTFKEARLSIAPQNVKDRFSKYLNDCKQTAGEADAERGKKDAAIVADLIICKIYTGTTGHRRLEDKTQQLQDFILQKYEVTTEDTNIAQPKESDIEYVTEMLGDYTA